MVNYRLLIGADLENLTNLQPQDGCDDPDFVYYFKLRCENCGEVTPKETCVCLNESVSLPKSRGTAHLVQKCKFCDREGNINMIAGQGQPLTLEASEAGKFSTLMQFDCRGFEPIDFAFGDGWKVESVQIWPYLRGSFSFFPVRVQEAGTKFENLDLSSGEFAEYDEKGECPVMISNLRASFEVVK